MRHWINVRKARIGLWMKVGHPMLRHWINLRKAVSSKWIGAQDRQFQWPSAQSCPFQRGKWDVGLGCGFSRVGCWATCLKRRSGPSRREWPGAVWTWSCAGLGWEVAGWNEP